MPVASSSFSWVKLRSGAWGIKGPDNRSGLVVVAKKSGEVQKVEIERKVWGNGSEAIYAIYAPAPKSARSPVRVSNGYWSCPACGEENPVSKRTCWECGCGR